MVDFSVGKRVRMRPDARKIGGINYRRNISRLGTISSIVHGVCWVYVHWDGKKERKKPEYLKILQLVTEEESET